ncbi:MAG: AAC(3) family N-acetyltransferase [Pirellulales bacterium]|nr:AAC(3) family N-acetyltransferase [Pirellulales bacterium]
MSTATTVSALTREQLCTAFRAVGLAVGDSVIVHSACSTLDPVEGGAETILDALLAILGPEGNLMLPTFNYTRPLPEPYFDPARTPGRTGILPETGRRRPGAVRSLHPTHSVTVIGPDAEALTRDHLMVRAFGVGSPIDRLTRRGGKVLLLGVGHTSNSLVHLAEEYAGIPKASWYDPLPYIKLLLPDGRVISHLPDTSPSCSSAFGGAEYALRRHGEIRDFRLGSCKLQLMAGQDVIRRVAETLAEKPDVLLCTNAGCRPCAGARQALREQGRI